MFINNVNRKEEIQTIAVQHLKKYGIKYRPKKPRSTPQAKRYGKKFFKVPLQNLETETVTLTNGQQLIVPKRIHEMCSYILSKVQTEGIFRKEGSKSRQNEIKLSLDRGCPLGEEHHVIDVAVVLKCFLRELTEPLIPQIYHELFLRCSILVENKLKAVLLACLLLPSDHLNVLSYLMQFFYEVASFSTYNKMTFNNLSILIGPNIFPIDEKMVPKSSLMITKICDITKLLIENSKSIGVIPDSIIEQIGQSTDIENERKRKNKRRSGSLTRMLNGLKKMVVGRVEEEPCPSMVPPDLILTPTIQNLARKRKADTGLSIRYKKAVINSLPGGVITPSRTPVSIHPNGLKNGEKNENENHKEKRMHWNMRSCSMKSLLKDDKSTLSSSNNNKRHSLGHKTVMERISSATFSRKKRRNSCITVSKKDLLANRKIEIKQEEPDYVRVPKREYIELGNRVSAIEKKMEEYDNDNGGESPIDTENDNNVNHEINLGRDNNIERVQTAYEQTMDSAALSPTQDLLVKRLSRNLRIRTSDEHKIIRSPSARKIGTIRRKSSEREKKNAQIVRNQSWHMGTSFPTNGTAPLLPRISVRRKKNPNQEAVGMGVNRMEIDSQESPPSNGITTQINLQRSTSLPKRPSSGISRNSLPRVSSSPSSFSIRNSLVHQSSPQCAVTVNVSDASMSRTVNYNTSGASSDHWVSAEGFFSAAKTPQDDAQGNARASIAKLRSQNLGMVRAKARLFDNYKESDTSSSSVQSNKSQPNSAKRVTTKNGSHKGGSPRSTESARMSYRIKALRAEDKRKKNSISPRRRHANVSQKQRLQQMGRQYIRCNKDSFSSLENTQDSLEFTTPRKDLNSLSPRKTPHPPHNVPYIKMPLTVKTPKRLCRTPGVDRKTPFRVQATPL